MTPFGSQSGKKSNRPRRTLREIAEDTRQRSNRFFPFAIADIAKAVGRTALTIHRAIKAGELNPRDLVSLSEYVSRYQKRKKVEENRAK
jgi:hypothetical protein